MTRSSGKSKLSSADAHFHIFLFALLSFWVLSLAGAFPARGQSASDPAVAGTPAAPARPPAAGPTLWVDFEKNAARLTSAAAVEAAVDTAYKSGFKRIIVDLKRADGSVAFKSRRAPRVELPFDYFGAFRKAGDARGMQVIAAIDVFHEGDTRTGKGPAFDNPAWQTVLGNTEIGLMPQTEFFQKGPVLFANPCLPEVQIYEASVIEDLLTELKPEALLLDEVRFFTRDADMSDSTHIRFESWSGFSHAPLDPNDPTALCWPGSVQKTNSPRIPLWKRFRTGVIREFLGRIRAMKDRVAPETALYLAAAGYYEPAVDLGLNWAHPDYKPVLWYADEKFQKTGAADIMDELFVLNRDANPRAVREVIRGARTVTRDKVALGVLIDVGQHVKSPNRFRENLQTVRDSGLGLVLTDLNLLGSTGYWTIVAEEFPPSP